MEAANYSMQQILEIISHLMGNNITGEEMEQLHQWLNQHEDNAWLYELLTDTDDQAPAGIA